MRNWSIARRRENSEDWWRVNSEGRIRTAPKPTKAGPRERRGRVEDVAWTNDIVKRQAVIGDYEAGAKAETLSHHCRINQTLVLKWYKECENIMRVAISCRAQAALDLKARQEEQPTALLVKFLIKKMSKILLLFE